MFAESRCRWKFGNGNVLKGTSEQGEKSDVCIIRRNKGGTAESYLSSLGSSAAEVWKVFLLYIHNRKKAENQALLERSGLYSQSSCILPLCNPRVTKIYGRLRFALLSKGKEG